jgi:ribonuclease-3
MQNNFSDLEEKLGHKFKYKELLINALTHKTYAFEANTPVEYNERLEFLGDSILNFIIAEKVYQTNSFFSEGELTRRRAMLVNNSYLAKKANELNLGKYLILGKGEQLQKGNNNPTNLANAFEAIIGAIYLDSNLKKVEKIISDILLKESKLLP